MRKYLYKNIKMYKNGYGVWIAYYVADGKAFQLSHTCSTKPVAYSIAKANVDYLNEKEGR